MMYVSLYFTGKTGKREYAGDVHEPGTQSPLVLPALTVQLWTTLQQMDGVGLGELGGLEIFERGSGHWGNVDIIIARYYDYHYRKTTM